MKYGQFKTKDHFIQYCQEQVDSGSTVTGRELQLLLELVPRDKSAWILADGEKVYAATADELVQIMHASSRTPAADDVAYMMDVSDRTVLQDGGRLRTANAAEFINDLIKHGLIRRAQ